jgi:pimeloyl-ACP methyl ester carboxylesterase
VLKKNHNRIPPTPPASIQDIIADTASEQSSAIAVSDASGASLTYKEVHDYALLLAAYLRNENLGQGWTIGICLSPSLWLPVAILGVLHAGDSFLPLDPKAGESWLAEHLEAGDAELVLCDSITEALLAGTGKKTLVVDREWPTISASTLPDAPFESPKIATHFAGTPTIDPPDLRALSPALLSMACNRSSKALGFQSNDRIVLADPAGTPGFCETILGCLRAGATLVIPPETTLKALLAANPTHLRLPAYLLAALSKEIPALSPEDAPQIKTLALEVKPTPIKCEALSAWFAAYPAQHQILQFLSPCGFCGVGLFMEVTDDKSLPTTDGFLALGNPTRLSGFRFADRSGHTPPPGYPGIVTYRMPFSTTQARSDLRIWRDVQGNFFLADIPEAPAVIETKSPSIQSVQTELPVESHFVSEAPEEHSADTAEAIHEAPDSTTSDQSSKPPFAVLGGNPDSPALLLLHGMDGSTATFASLLPLLTPDWEIFGTFAPAREPRNFYSEVDCIESLLLEHWKDIPIHLLGIGYGGLLAFELTSRLRASGIDVPCLLIAGTPAPGPARGGWLGKLKRGLASVQGQHPEGATLPEMAESLRPKIIAGRAGIILTSDMPDDSELRWLGLVPDATFENARGSLQELLTTRTAEFLRAIKALSGT